MLDNIPGIVWIMGGALIPIFLPNAKVYKWTKATASKTLVKLTPAKMDAGIGKLWYWILGTVIAICEGVADAVQEAKDKPVADNPAADGDVPPDKRLTEVK